MTRAERERRKYIKVRNITYDAELARKARGWSEERIFKTLGIKIPKRVPRLKPLPSERVKVERLKARAALQVAKFNYLVAGGVDKATAKRLKRKSWAEINKRVDRHAPPTIDRENQWNQWAKHQKFPEYIKKQAQKINTDKGLDPNARYGWAAVFNSYITGEPVERWMDMWKPDPFDGDRYTEIAGQA